MGFLPCQGSGDDRHCLRILASFEKFFCVGDELLHLLGIESRIHMGHALRNDHLHGRMAPDWPCQPPDTDKKSCRRARDPTLHIRIGLRGGHVATVLHHVNRKSVLDSSWMSALS